MNSNQRSRRGNQRRSPSTQRPRPDLWREPGPLPDIEPIRVTNDATALVRSLGDPPLANGADAALQFVIVVEGAARVAAALALSAGLLGPDQA